VAGCSDAAPGVDPDTVLSELSPADAQRVCAYTVEQYESTLPTRREYCTKEGLDRESTEEACQSFVVYCLDHDVTRNAQEAVLQERGWRTWQPVDCGQADATAFEDCDASFEEFAACLEARVARKRQDWEARSCADARPGYASMAFFGPRPPAPAECEAYERKCPPEGQSAD
jgi:hypothetical protein